MEAKEFIVLDDTNAKCLCVPLWFMKRTEKLKNWTIVKLDLNNIVPDKNTVFERFVAIKQKNKSVGQCFN